MENSKIFALNQELIANKGRYLLDQNKKIEIFGVSNGWFRIFINRFNLKYTKTYGKASLVDISEKQNEIDFIKEKINNYHSEDIYNNDESPLFWQKLSQGSYDIKKLKEHLSLSFIVNCTETMKFLSIVIRKSQNPRAFKKFSVSDAFIYYFQKKA